MVGGKTQHKDERYADFAEFLWALQESMPAHLRRNVKKSSFIRDASIAASSGRKFASEAGQLETA
jgi:hypothetical protein